MGKFYKTLIDKELDLPSKYWKGEFQANVEVKKLHKPFYLKKSKWLVLSNKGNIYLFDKPNSEEINCVLNIKDYFIQQEDSKILLTNSKKKYEFYFNNEEFSLFLKKYYDILYLI